MSGKVSLYNQADLKNTSDDAIPNYLNSLKFKQSHYFTDVRLALGYGAVVLATACFMWDYKFGFESTKLYTTAAVACYVALSAALAQWIKTVEKGAVYLGVSPSGKQEICITSITKKNIPTYNLAISVTDIPESGSKEEPKARGYNISRPFSEWFDETGLFVARPFQEMLATVPVIGQQDPRRVKTASQKILDADPALLDAVLAADAAGAEGSSTAAEPAGKKGGSKRRKGQ